jgi:hypothetical protein
MLKNFFFAYLTTIYLFLGIVLLIRYIQKNGILKKVIFPLIKNKMWKFFLINFGIYVGYKKKLNKFFITSNFQGIGISVQLLEKLIF